MSKYPNYENQVFPDIFNKELTIFKKDKDLLEQIKKFKDEKATVYVYCSSACSDSGELGLTFRDNSEIVGYVSIEDVTYKMDAHNKVHVGRSIDSVDTIIGVKIKEIENQDGVTRIKCSRKDVVMEIEKKYNSDVENGKLKEGLMVKGVVTGMEYNKVYVDIGGDVTGILGVADIARVFVKDPSEVIVMGQVIELVIKKIYANPLKVSLSRAMLLNGWDTIEKKYKVGWIVAGKVKNSIATGLFIELDESFEGLAENLLEGKKYNYGDRVKVCIHNIDKKREKIKLKLIENR